MKAAVTRNDVVQTLALSLLGGLLSVLFSGFVFGIDNNAFHLPIVAALYDEPQFADDLFVQSLRRFSSGVWMSLSGSSQALDTKTLFLVFHIASRALSFLGFLLCASLLGVDDIKKKVCFVLALCVTPLLQGASYAGGAGLFLNYFSHSEIANGLVLLLVYSLVRERFFHAAALTGVIFLINAFMAVWCLVPLLAVFVHSLCAPNAAFRKLWRDLLFGGAVAFVIALPVLLLLFKVVALSPSVAFDVVSYLRSYWPYHFVFDTIDFLSRLALVFIFIASCLSLPDRASARDIWTKILLSFCAVYVVGIFLPELTKNPTLLYLHLLRVGGIVHLLAALFSVSLAVRWTFSSSKALSLFWGPVFLFMLCASDITALLSCGLLLLEPYKRIRYWIAQRFDGSLFLFRGCVLAGLFFVVSGNALDIFRSNSMTQAVADEWFEVGAWARQHTAADAVFMPDLRNPEGSARPTPYSDAAPFLYASHRRVWFDPKFGAAVMWSPEYYEVWTERLAAWHGQRSLQEKLAFAQENGISYVIAPCSEPEAVPPVFRTKRLCVYG